MPRIRTIVLVVTLCLLVFGGLAAPATARHSGPIGAKRAVTVYITDTGEKYHAKGCRYLDHSRKRVTLKWAKSHGYKPCKVCRPPR